MRCCAQPGCSALVPKGYCPTHARSTDLHRGSSFARGYDAQWAAYSRRFRQEHPVCGERADGTLDRVHSRCVQQGLTTPAACVDHTVPLSHGGSKWDVTNHMAACQACNIWKAHTIDKEQVAR